MYHRYFTRQKMHQLNPSKWPHINSHFDIIAGYSFMPLKGFFSALHTALIDFKVALWIKIAYTAHCDLSVIFFSDKSRFHVCVISSHFSVCSTKGRFFQIDLQRSKSNNFGICSLILYRKSIVIIEWLIFLVPFFIVSLKVLFFSQFLTWKLNAI